MTVLDNTELTSEFIDLIAEEVHQNGGPLLSDLFAKRGAPDPIIQFDPYEQDLQESRLVVLYRYWKNTMVDTGLPLAAKLDPIDFVKALPIVMLLDILDDGMDFRYLIYGDEIAERFGRNMVGHRTSEMPIPPNVTALFLGGYRTAMQHRKPVLTEHAPPRTVSVTTWRRLILPLGDENGKVVRILVGNIPGVWRRPISHT